MNWIILSALLVPCAVLLIIELRGVTTTLSLKMRGDINRESKFLAQYGQSVCTPLVALLVWQLDKVSPGRHALMVLASTCAASASAGILKRLFGRSRPNRDHAGKFLGPTWKHANWRESFPSSHSACAMAMSIPLAVLYPPAAVTFFSLAVLTAVLRYLLDAHWPSDVLAGLALGYVCAYGVMELFARYA
jgi:membrane-associated phospholipid phosphatase